MIIPNIIMENVVFELSVILISTAFLCVIAEIAKQPLIVAYIIAGFLAGPFGFGLIHGNGFFSAISTVGIILLLYLIGLELRPREFATTLKKSSIPAVLGSMTIIPFGAMIGWISGLSTIETIYLTIAFLFSSTVVVMHIMKEEKKIDRTVYDTCIGMLLIQDIIAVFTLLIFNSTVNATAFNILVALKFFGFGILFVGFAFLLQHYLFRKVIRRVLHRADLVFLLGLAWCFFFAELAHFLALSREIGGFIAGLSLTSLPQYKLRVFINKSETIRDFFMILFFFILGAEMNPQGLTQYRMLIVISLIFVLIGKPFIYYFYTRLAKYTKGQSKEIALRLGQISEFSIIVALLGVVIGQITAEFAMAIQIILFASIILSNYVVRYFPIRAEEKL